MTYRNDSGKHVGIDGKWRLDGSLACTKQDIEDQEKCYEYLSNGTARYIYRIKGSKFNAGYFYRITDHDFSN